MTLPRATAGQPGSLATSPEEATYLIRGKLTDPAVPATRHAEVLGIFSDPVIHSYTTCIGDLAVGTAENVAEALSAAELASRGMDGNGVAVAVP